MSDGESHDPMRRLVSEFGQMAGFLKAHVANQEQINQRTLQVLDRLTQSLAETNERVAVNQNNASCVPDLYEKHRTVSGKVAYGAGGMAVLVVLMSIFGPFIGRWILGRFGG